MEEIIIGVLASIIASVILWVFSQLYSFNTRKRVAYKIMLMRNDNYDYQKFLQYRDYDLALLQVQRMLDEISDLYSYIKPLTYSRKKKKLICTLLNSLHYTLSYFQRYYEGCCGGDSEKETCCEEAQRHLYVVGFKYEEGERYHDPLKFQSVSEVTIELLSELNTHKKIKDILLSGHCFNGSYFDKPTIKKWYKELMHVNAFKDSFSKEVIDKFCLTSSTMDRKTYEKMIDSL